MIDHEDRCTSNNKWKNLRPVTHAENMLNRTPRAATVPSQPKPEVDLTAPKQNPKNPYLGVHMLGPSRFRASIKLKGKVTQLGYFETPEAANEAFVEAWKAARKVA